MNYELAKQLKDAGFGFSQAWCDEIGTCKHPTCTFPNLEELIEACGDDFWSLINSKLNKGVWIARQYILAGEIIEEGSTPTEAVANLFIKLKQNA